MNVDSYTPGTPCWADVACADIEQSAAFYSGLLGWEAPEGNPEFGGYRSATLNGRTVAGLMARMDENQPVVWCPYVCSADTAATVATWEAAGGSVIAPTMDVGDLGRMAIVADPAGAVLGIWQPGLHTGAQVYNEPGAMCWIELTTSDLEGSKAFYSKVFGWGLGGGGGYTEFHAGDTSVAGMMAPPMQGMPNFWGVYFAVADVDASCGKVTELGGNVLVPPTDIEPGRFAVVQDPGGATFSLITLKPGMA